MTNEVVYDRDQAVVLDYVLSTAKDFDIAFVIVVRDTATGDLHFTDVKDVSPIDAAEMLDNEYQREVVAVISIDWYLMTDTIAPIEPWSGNAATVDAP